VRKQQHGLPTAAVAHAIKQSTGAPELDNVSLHLKGALGKQPQQQKMQQHFSLTWTALSLFEL
jgi:hypothetical protein